MFIKISKYGRAAVVPVVLLFAALFVQGCEKFEYSPYEVRLSDEEKDINKRSIERIKALDVSPSDTLRFVLTSDPQGFYHENKKLVKQINTLDDIAFVLIGGDLTDFGLTKEFRLVHKDFKTLKVPYVAVVGNHDAVNNGKEVFSAMYGDFDVSFGVGNSRFILLNTNAWEFKGEAPDLEWLEQELKAAQSYEHIFVLSHIPPTNGEFGEKNAEKYSNLLKQYHATFSLHGHNHSYKLHYPYGEQVPYMESAAADDLEYVVFTIVGDKVSFERIII